MLQDGGVHFLVLPAGIGDRGRKGSDGAYDGVLAGRIGEGTGVTKLGEKGLGYGAEVRGILIEF